MSEHGVTSTEDLVSFLDSLKIMSLDYIDDRRLTWMQRAYRSPYVTIAKTLYGFRMRDEPPVASEEDPMTVVCISDTHNTQPFLPPGDLLIHAGDLTHTGTIDELQSQLDWIDNQPFAAKVVIAGNHDIALDSTKAMEFGQSWLGHESLQWGSIVYLNDRATHIKFAGGRTLKIYGTPWTLERGNWAFQYDKGVDMFSNQVDDDVDILITHSAPKLHLDAAGWGDEYLLKELWRVRPKLHVFGHIHEGYGRDVLSYDHFEYLYEKICDRTAGVLALVQMALILLHELIIGTSQKSNRTTLVNASVVGGMLDRGIRRPQIVRI